MPDTRIHIFISHIHDEAALGSVIKNQLEDAFSKRIEVFVSSDPRDNPGGDEWLEKIRAELKHPQGRMLVSIVSPASINKSWISVEAGAAWILDRKVFPLCHSGLRPGDLPRPLQDFGGADLSASDSAIRLIMATEQATGLRVPEGWPRETFLKMMREAVHQLPLGGTRVRGASAVITTNDRPEPQVKILQFLAQMDNQGFDEGVPEESVIRETGVKPAAFRHHIDELCHRGRLVLADVSSIQPTMYRLGPNGSKWLIEHDLMPE
jgi:hypothetical protein